MKDEGSKINPKTQGHFLVAGILFILFVLLAYFFYQYTYCKSVANLTFTNLPATTARLGCGQAALMAIAQAHGEKTASKLHFLFKENQSAKSPVTSFYDLANWSRAIGMKPIGLKIDATDLTEIPLPAIVHVNQNHFLALTKVDDKKAVLVDQGNLTKQITRKDFEKQFSGYVLCFR